LKKGKSGEREGQTTALKNGGSVFKLLSPAGNIADQAATTTYTDTHAVGLGRFFYRVGVQ
jgi:hypothetical protein